MVGFRSFIAKFRNLCGRRRSEAEFDEEIQAHLSMLADRFVRRGMTTEQAWSTARRQFGNATLLKETRREVTSFVSFETLWQDLRFAIRTLKRSPGVTTAIILTLMLGIGVNTALFSVIYAALLKPLPYRGPDRLVFMTEKWTAGNDTMSGADLEYWRGYTHAFEAMAGVYASDRDLNINGDAVSARIVFFSGSLERVFGISPALGRGFLPEEMEYRAAGEPRRVALISDRLFRERFSADPALLGKTISLAGVPVTVVVGVLPPGFRFALPGIFGPPKDIDVMLNNQSASPSTQSWVAGSGLGPRVQAVGRLKRGVTLETARAEIEVIRASLKQQGIPQAAWYRGKRELVMMPLRDRIVGNSRLALLTLWGAVGFVLLVACVNVANLLLARAAARSRETAMRVALGASRARLIRQLLTESILLAFAGGAGGVVVASVAIQFIVEFGPTEIPQLRDAVLNARVLMFSFAVCAFTGILSGLAPAAAGSRSGRTTYGPERRRLHALLVTSELVFALLLLSGAGLMLKSLWVMRSRVAAIAPEQVLTTNLNVRNIALADPEQYLADLATQMEAVPGVRATAVIGGGRTHLRFTGLPAPPPDRQVIFDLVSVTPHFPSAAGVRLLSGRWLSDKDSAQAPPVMVVNETTARLYLNLYPSSGPIIGRQLDVGRPFSYTAVGIVSDFPRQLDAEPPPQVFVTHWQWPREGVTAVLMRTSSDPMALANSLRGIIRRTPRIEMKPVETLEDQMTEAIAPRRFQAALLAAFAALALLLAMVGVYGVLSYDVTGRTHDIGVRMALGARQRDVVGMVLGRAARLAGAGIALGLIASLGLTRLMSSLLYGVKPSDPWTYAAVSLLLMTVAALAAYLPARRAVRVDPLVALRYE